MPLHPCETNALNEGFVHLLQGFNPLIKSLTLKTLFDRILSKDPIWEGFVALDF